MEEPATGVFDDDKHVEDTEGRRDHDTKVTGHDAFGVGAEKR